MALLTRIEEIIGIPLEWFHQQRGFHPVDLNRMALRCMEQGTRKGIRQTYAPNAYTVMLNPADYHELVPFLDTIASEIKGELQRVAEERKYLLAGELTVSLTAEGNTPEGKPQIDGMMQGNDESVATVMLSDVEQVALPVFEGMQRDAATVIHLPADEQEGTDPIEDSISLLREGKVHAASDCLSKVDPEESETPRFLAAKAVVMEMQGQPSKAGKYYQRLLAIDGTRPDLQHRIAHLATRSSEQAGVGVSSRESGRIELGDTGASLRFSADAVELDNPRQDPMVMVNGTVQQRSSLKDGDTIRIGFLEMNFKQVRDH